MMLLTTLRTLDDRTALTLLASIAGPRSRFAPGEAPPAATLRAALDTTFGEPPSASASSTPASEGDLARAALVVAAEDPTIAKALATLLDHSVPAVMGTGFRHAVSAVAFAVLRSHLKVDFQIPGALSFHLEKPPAPDSAVLALARTLQASLPAASSLTLSAAPSHPNSTPHSAQSPHSPASTPFAPHPSDSASPPKLSVFVARAPADASHAADLKKALAPWLHRDAFQWWSEDDLTAGDLTTSTVQSYLDTATLILLLVSPDLLASLPHWSQLQRALERHRDGTARVVPILVRPSAWTQTDLAALSPLPKDERFITTWKDPDEAWLSVVQGLQALL